jgi:hypothetical protein
MLVEAMATLRAAAICTTDEAMNRRWLIAGTLIVLLVAARPPMG